MKMKTQKLSLLFLLSLLISLTTSLEKRHHTSKTHRRSRELPASFTINEPTPYPLHTPGPIKRTITFNEKETFLINLIKQAVKAIELPEGGLVPIVRLVGGGPRDKLLGKEINDLDFVFQNISGLTVLNKILEDKAISHLFELPNDSTAHDHKRGIQITVFYFDGLEVDFISLGNVSFQEDKLARDSTINSIYYNIITENFDDSELNIKDLENGILRTDPNIKAKEFFIEDPNRLIRYVRLSIKLGFMIDEKVLHIIKEASAELIKGFATRNINAELDKLFKGSVAPFGIHELYRRGLLTILLSLRKTPIKETKDQDDIDEIALKTYTLGEAYSILYQHREILTQFIQKNDIFRLFDSYSSQEFWEKFHHVILQYYGSFNNQDLSKYLGNVKENKLIFSYFNDFKHLIANFGLINETAELLKKLKLNNEDPDTLIPKLLLLNIVVELGEKISPMITNGETKVKLEDILEVVKKNAIWIEFVNSKSKEISFATQELIDRHNEEKKKKKEEKEKARLEKKNQKKGNADKNKEEIKIEENENSNAGENSKKRKNRRRNKIRV